jgi:hypothetical protein
VPVTEPTAEITSDVTGVAAGPFTLTFTFNLDIGDSFVTNDVVVTNATGGALAKVSATVYTMQVTPPLATTGVCIIEVPPGAVTAAGTGVSNSRSLASAVLYRT